MVLLKFSSEIKSVSLSLVCFNNYCFIIRRSPCHVFFTRSKSRFKPNIIQKTKFSRHFFSNIYSWFFSCVMATLEQLRDGRENNSSWEFNLNCYSFKRGFGERGRVERNSSQASQWNIHHPWGQGLPSPINHTPTFMVNVLYIVVGFHLDCPHEWVILWCSCFLWLTASPSRVLPSRVLLAGCTCWTSLCWSTSSTRSTATPQQCYALRLGSSSRGQEGLS